MNQPVYTFQDKRKCLYCGTPIADQTHKMQKFCSKEIYADGSIKNCKDRFWTEQRRNDRSLFTSIEAYHRSCSESLYQLYNLDLPYLTLDHLTDMGIDLSKCLLHRISGSEQQFFYIGFCVRVNSFNKQPQIQPHNEQLF
jgi:hypothetical protein